MADTRKDGVAIIMPVINERKNLQGLLPLLAEFNVFVVDDGSNDGTQEFCESLSHVHLIERGRKMGLVSAILEGFRHVPENCEYSIVLDSDFSHDPKYIPELHNYAIKNDADLVIGSRYTPGGKNGDEPLRRFISVSGNIAFRSAFSSRVKDATSGFRVYSKRAMAFLLASQSAEPVSPSYAGQIDVLRRVESAKMKVVEYPITFYRRKNGRSNLSNSDIMGFLSLLIRKGNLISYVMVGLSGILVNELILSLLFGVMGYPAELFSIEVSVVSNFILNDRLTFGKRDSIVSEVFFSRLARYNFYSLGGIGINAIVFYLLVALNVDILVSNFVGIVFAFLFTYISSTFFVWGEKIP